jgi:hypothetical protein
LSQINHISNHLKEIFKVWNIKTVFFKLKYDCVTYSKHVTG